MVVKQAARTSRKARPLRHSEEFSRQRTTAKKTSDKVDVSEMRRRVKKLGHRYCTLMKGRREINRNMSEEIGQPVSIGMTLK
jgi:hypothetical protein